MSDSINNINSSLYTSDTSSTSGLLKGASTTDTTATKVSAASLGKDDFLKLLLARCRIRIPESTDNTEFVAQLAQFSSLEQMSQMNTNLDN